jgi:hypothetical protein
MTTMTITAIVDDLVYLQKFTTQKVDRPSLLPIAEVPDSLAAWMVRYLTLAVVGVRSDKAQCLRSCPEVQSRRE